MHFLKHQLFARDLPWAILNQTILSIGAVAIIILLSNVLEAQEFGKARFLTAVLTIFAFFSLPGIGPVVLQQMPLYSRDGFTRALSAQLKWGIGAAAGAALFAVVYYFQGDDDLAFAFAISGILTPVANLYLMPGTALAGLKRFREKTFYDGAIIVTIVLGATYGALSTGTVAGTMLWYFGAQSIATLTALYFVTRHLTTATPMVIDTEADTRYGKQLTLFQIPFTLLPALEKVLVFFLLGPIPLAIYVIAMLPIEHIRNAYRNMLQFFVLPQFTESESNEKTVTQWMVTAIILSLGSVFVVIAFCSRLFTALFCRFHRRQITYVALSNCFDGTSCTTLCAFTSC